MICCTADRRDGDAALVLVARYRRRARLTGLQRSEHFGESREPLRLLRLQPLAASDDHIGIFRIIFAPFRAFRLLQEIGNLDYGSRAAQGFSTLGLGCDGAI